MGLFSRREPRPPAGADAGDAAAIAVAADAHGAPAALGPRGPGPGSIWGDRLGRWATRSLQVLIVVALAALAIWGLSQVTVLVIPVLVAIIVASAASPLIAWLRRHGVSPMLAAWITLLSGILVLGGIVTGIVFAVRNQWQDLADSAVQGFDHLLEWATSLPIPIDQQQIDDARNAIVDFVTSAEFGAGALAGVSAAAEIATGAVLMFVMLFFFLKDGDVIWAFFLRPFRGRDLERGRRVGVTSVKVLGGYVRGTAIVAFVDALFIGIGLAILQVPLALPLGVLVFLASFIPIVGATITGILAALVALVANGPIVALIVIAIVIGVNQLEGNFLQPVVMAQSLKLHPLVILIALTAGSVLAGIVGAVLAVPIAAVTWAIIKVWDGPDPSIDARKSFRRRRRADAATDAAVAVVPDAGPSAGTPVA